MATVAATKEEILPISVPVVQGSNTSCAVPAVKDYHSNDHTIVAPQPDGAVCDGSKNTSVRVRKKRRLCCYRQKANCYEHITYFCALSVASYIGVLMRIYLSRLATWNGVPLFPSLYPEIIGTAIMGFISSHKLLLGTNYKATYQGIATGLCGSITTFSSWNSEAMSILLQTDTETPDNVTRLIGWGSTILLGFGMPIAALLFGKHVACLSPWSDSKLESRLTRDIISGMESQPRRTWCVLFEGIGYVLSWIVCTVIGVVLTYKFNQLDLMFSILFASLGTYTRWHLAPCNGALAQFKLGTFLANILGSWILGGAIVARNAFSETHAQDHLLLSVVSGIATGFCGCLTTVSTFTVELSTLSLKGTYIYAVCSLVFAQVGLLVIRGTYEWTR